MGLFYQDRILFELYGFLQNFGIKPSDLLAVLHEKRMDLGEGIAGLYHSFNTVTDEELWESGEDLERYTKSGRDVIDAYVSGELGNNVLFRHRAMAFLDLVDEVHEAAFGAASELLRSKDDSLLASHRQYLDELKLYSTLRKRNVFDLDARYSKQFSYDFQSLLENDFQGLPKLLDKPTEISFYSAQDTKEMIRFQQYVQGTDLNGIAKIVSRIPCAKLQRAVAFEDQETGLFDPEGRVATTMQLSPGEFV